MDDKRGLKIPFSAWYKTDNYDVNPNVQKLEQYLGDDAIVADSYQTCVQMVCEVLGSRQYAIPVILPVTASAQTLAGVYWAGATPVILDVDETLHVKQDALQEALDGLGGAVVVIERVGCYDVPPALLEAAKGVPTIVCTRWPPHGRATEDELNLCGSFNVFDMTEVAGSGGVIYHKYDKQKQQLYTLRDSVLGHNAGMSDELAYDAYKKLNASSQARKYTYRRIVRSFTEELQKYEQTAIIPWSPAKLAGPLFFTVPDVLYMQAHLKHNGYPSRPAVLPLHRINAVAQKFPDSDKIRYPNADKLFNRIIALPTHAGVEPYVKTITEKMIEATK